MRAAWNKIGILALVLLFVLSGCKKRKPAVPPPQQQAPTITQPQPLPPVEQPPAQPTQPQPQPTTPTTTLPQPTTPTTTAKPKPKLRRHRAAKKPVEPKNNKTVVKEGGESNVGGQLSASISPAEATHQRQTTVQLREATENNLRSITRTLSADEQSMVQQIRAFLSQSRAADHDGDTERAYNLALKARLLSDELVKP
jgi:type IV secretory pathway VirB10-like protein